MAKYWEGLRAEVQVSTSHEGPLVPSHKEEWQKLMAGMPVEILPSVGSGFRVRQGQRQCARAAA